jgi:3',5'-nucleoside bisphosphate phosphatase
MIDLHSHTTASDGQFAPAAQVALAAKAGVTVLAITDHDTVDGVAEASLEAQRLGLRLIAGIEISIIHNRRELHILGHFVDPTDDELARHAVCLKAERDGRMEEMLRRLASVNIRLDLEEVRQVANGAPLARPHLARALVERRICASVREAFDRFLGDGKVAHVMRQEVTAAQAIGLIHRAHGTATLAHPGPSKVNRLEVETFAQAGLDGLEVGHLDHPPSQQEKFREWARALSLVCTAGSDFHGQAIAPDRLFGHVTMSPSELEALEARRH